MASFAGAAVAEADGKRNTGSNIGDFDTFALSSRGKPPTTSSAYVKKVGALESSAQWASVAANKRAYRLSTQRERPSFTDIFSWEEGREAQYAAFRSQGNLYFKGKAGYIWDDEEQDIDELSFSEFVTYFEDNTAVGLGAGYKLNNGERIEFEYTINKNDEKVFSIGYTF